MKGRRKTRAPAQLPPKRLDDLERFWDEQVGELPEGDVRSKFAAWVRQYGRPVVLRAIEKQADNDSNDTSDAVFEAVRLTLRAWAARKWCP